MSSLPLNLQSALIWPIQAKGAVTRLTPLGDPSIEQFYHAAMEQGRFLETSIADANHWLLQKKQLLEQQIQIYTHMNQLATDGQLTHLPRVFKYIADSIAIIQAINTIQRGIIGLIQACIQNITTLLAIEQSMLAMVRSSLNALANLLNNICNWGLPKLPSIPNLFPDTVWNWNGFNFSPLANFAAALTKGFNFNFSFGQCSLINPNNNIFSSTPASINTYSGLQLGTLQVVPPLNGTILTQDPTDPSVIAQMQGVTAVPYYNPNTFNPLSSMLGAVPDPSTIVSDYQMPPQTYQDNIVSIVPTLRQDTIEPTDADYSNPNLTLRQANLRKDLIHFITLEQVVASKYDPYITSAWLFYLNLTRNGRSGTWLQNFQAVYDQQITPSIESLSTNAVPWNDVLGGIGVQDTPNDIPLIDTFNSLSGAALTTLFWKLSYIEAALLGYTRAKDWDTTQDANYLSGVTGSDLDYVPTTITTDMSSLTLGQGTAEYPVPITFPAAISNILNQVIAQATLDILNDTSYQSPRLGNRFTYDQFAQATAVDRFSQFWRDFSTNLTAFLAQDPYLVQFAVTYFGTLNGAINPLGDQTAYQALQLDVSTRNRSWTPGTPLLNIPQAPIVAYQNNSGPQSGESGWQGTTFDPETFLSRPDIQGQPIPVQLAMLRTNLSYAGISQWANNMSAQIQSQVQTAQALLQTAQQFGFQVESKNDTTIVPVNPAGVAISFDQIDFDLTGNVTNSDTFTIQSTGQYALFGMINWGSGAAGGTRTVILYQNGTAILNQSTDPSASGPTTLSFSSTDNFSQGDIVQIFATHTFNVAQDVVSGSLFSMIQVGPTMPSTPPVSNSSNTYNITVSNPLPSWITSFPALTAFSIQADGTASPLDPFVPAITNIAIASNVSTVTATNHFTAGQMVVFSGLTTATFLNNQVVTISTASSGQFTAAFTHANYPSAADTGTVLLAVDGSGAFQAPNPDGVSLIAGNPGDTIQAAVTYGGVFEVSGASFTPGGLLYVGPAGLLTQNYTTLITEVSWVIVIGRAISTNTFIYEPHVPTLVQ